MSSLVFLYLNSNVIIHIFFFYPCYTHLMPHSIYENFLPKCLLQWFIHIYLTVVSYWCEYNAFFVTFISAQVYDIHAPASLHHNLCTFFPLFSCCRWLMNVRWRWESFCLDPMSLWILHLHPEERNLCMNQKTLTAQTLNQWSHTPALLKHLQYLQLPSQIKSAWI